MHSTHMPTVEIHDLSMWDEHFAGTHNLAGWVVQSVDLTGRAADLEMASLSGTLFLGCTFPQGLKAGLREKGALIFPRLPNLSFNPYRSRLYEATELYDSVVAGGSYATSCDAQIYSWAKGQQIPAPLTSSLAMSLHDHAISDALDELLAEVDAERTVGVMGGHAMRRGSDPYHTAARLGALLAGNGHTVLTGGGPGAMEAANLGAYFNECGQALDAAVEQLATSPLFCEQPTAWVRSALDVRQSLDGGAASIGVPTWYYGHEPANLFATGIAKYFSNAVREDTLLERCHGGLIYLPGAAGTVQEVFQATTRNYYSNDPELITPMVFVGTQHWTTTLPVWPLITAMGSQRVMSKRLLLTDDIDEAGEWLSQWV